jgi:hypothetical protein
MEVKDEVMPRGQKDFLIVILWLTNARFILNVREGSICVRSFTF